MTEEQNSSSIEFIDPFHPDAIQLLHEAAREIQPPYEPNFYPGNEMPANLPPVPGSIYLIARYRGKPIGSAALRPYEGAVGEVIRMYVLPAYRRKQVARSLLIRIEKEAIEFGYRTLRLETGDRQPAAIAFYERSGYKRIQAFGRYVDDPTSVCFEKQLAPDNDI